jgi:hypothetical protein
MWKKPSARKHLNSFSLDQHSSDPSAGYSIFPYAAEFISEHAFHPMDLVFKVSKGPWRVAIIE